MDLELDGKKVELEIKQTTNQTNKENHLLLHHSSFIVTTPSSMRMRMKMKTMMRMRI